MAVEMIADSVQGSSQPAGGPIEASQRRARTRAQAGPNAAAVRAHLLEHVNATRTDVVRSVPEFWVPVSNERADLVLLGELLEAFEIKSAHDNLTRLPRQVDAFSRLFDQCTAVVAAQHVDQARELIPGWWGLVRIGEGQTNALEAVRPPKRNPWIHPASVVRLLWKSEARSALVALGQQPTVSASRRAMWDDLLIVADRDTLSAIVRSALRARDPRSARIKSGHSGTEPS